MSGMETYIASSWISNERNPSFERSSFISIIHNSISTKHNNGSDELSPAFELSPTSTEHNPSFDDSSAVSIEPGPISEHNPNSIVSSFNSIEPKPSSDHDTCISSVEMNLRNVECNNSFRHCLPINSATTRSLKSNQAPSEAPNSSSPATVSPRSLSRFQTLFPPPRKSKDPLSISSFKNFAGCDGTNFSFNFCTLQSVLKFTTCETQRTGPSRKIKPDVLPETPINNISPVSVSQVKKATGGFSHSLLIGQGVFSSVYDGILKDGTRVAIKCDKKSLYTPKGSIEFQSNIKILQSLDHPNLVKFYGYLEHNENSIFILQYVPNGDLRQHLDGKYMGFGVRLDIAIEVAHGLAYLHGNQDQPILHGRLRSSNILLSSNMRAMVSDYGFPPVAGVGVDSLSSNIILLSYCDPEFLFTFRLTEKSDVYSFGVVLVELLTGRPPLMGNPDCFNYVTTEWAKTMFDQGRASVVLDPHIPRIPATMFVMEKVLALAVLCLNREGKNRPTMSFCAEALEHISEEYTLILFGSHDCNR